jgi:hypothetical protein
LADWESMVGVDLRAALAPRDLRGVFPPVDLRAVCFVRAIPGNEVKWGGFL